MVGGSAPAPDPGRKDGAPGAASPGFDSVLGPASGRYFGDGYRRTRYQVSPIREAAALGVQTFQARADVHYPSDWSIKAGSGRRPHLSTIDALVLSVRVVEGTLVRGLGLVAADVARAWLRSLSVRTGTAPVQSLGDIPVECRVAESEKTSSGHQSTLRLKVGTFTVDAVVEHPEPGSLSGAAAPDGEAPYWHGFRTTSHQSKVTLIDASRGAIECRTTATAPTGTTAGLEGAYGPQPTLIDALVFAGQMLQILVCATDGTSREESGNLWLRRIRFDSASPHRPAQSRPMIEVTSRSALERGGATLHSLKARSTAMFGTTMLAQVAYADRPD